MEPFRRPIRPAAPNIRTASPPAHAVTVISRVPARRLERLIGLFMDRIHKLNLLEYRARLVRERHEPAHR